MSARSARAATAGSLALALALALPAAAFADDDDRSREGAAAERSDERAGERAGERGRSGTAPHGSTSSGSAEGSSSGADPRGNNGTVKVDGEAFDDGRGNEPHVGCTFSVDFYGFDAGDTATITFTGVAPTGGGLLHTESRTISTDAAGGGQDLDATVTYSVTDQLSGLGPVAPHAQQGWHVKLAVDVDGAPGGAKQKVLWIDCPTPVAPAGTTTAAGSGTPSTETVTPTSGTVVGQGAGTATVLPATVVGGTTVAAAERQDALTLGAGTATLAAAETSAAGTVSAQGAVQPSALPFTGPQALLSLLALGLGAVGAGALAHRTGRRTAEV